MGCRLSKDEESTIQLQHFNMLVVGYPEAGKTKLLSAIKGSHNDEKHTLDINTITINSTLKLMVFEVSGKAQMTWKNFYPITDLLMFVIDPTEEQSLPKAKTKLVQMDSSLKKTAKMFIVVNKIDKLLSQNDTETTSTNNETQVQNQQATSIVNQLNLGALKRQTSWGKCSAETGQGLKELVNKLQSFLLMNSGV